MLSLATTELAPDPDWIFFHPMHPISAEDRSRIRRLVPESAQAVWEAIVSADPMRDHPMRLRGGHWRDRIETFGPNCEESWEDPTSDAVADFLRSRITWGEEAEVLFFWGRQYAVSTPWGVFLRTWRNFLFDDEGPFLIRLEHPEFIAFSPHGSMGVGRRT